MTITLDGTLGITTPSETNTGTLSVTGVTTLTGGLNAALPVLSGGTGVTTKTGTGAVVLGTSPTLATPTFDSAQLSTVVGTAPLFMCRAWCNFNGTGTVAIRASGNVSSITDNGTGDYTVNFSTAMSDANYAAMGMSAGFNGTRGAAGITYQYRSDGASGTAPQTTSCAFKLWDQADSAANAVLSDWSIISTAFFR